MADQQKQTGDGSSPSPFRYDAELRAQLLTTLVSIAVIVAAITAVTLI